MNQMKRYLIILPMIVLAACYKDNKEDMYGSGPGAGCDTTNVTYAATIQPLLQSKCATSGCHNAASSSAGINLSNHAGAKAIADNGFFLRVIRHESGVAPMPQGGAKLDDCTIAQIQKWVNDGAPNN